MASEHGESDFDVFNSKYTEFCADLEGACPELATEIRASAALPPAERKRLFKEQVLPSCSPKRNSATAPAFVLPGVPMQQGIWDSLSDNSKKAIQEYLTILSFTLLVDSSANGGGAAAAAGMADNFFTAEWAKEMMDEMKGKLGSTDFENLASKLENLFKSAGPDGFPSLPEKFLKGQIAKLAEEMLKELKVEDFGIDKAAMEAAGNDPSKAFQLVMDVFLRNPQTFQNTMGKMVKKLQHKVQTGALRPQELVAEAEELMKTFSENPQFVEIMETFRQAFSFPDMDEGRGASTETGRLSLVRERLRKKLEAKKAAGKR